MGCGMILRTDFRMVLQPAFKNSSRSCPRKFLMLFISLIKTSFLKMNALLLTKIFHDFFGKTITLIQQKGVIPIQNPLTRSDTSCPHYSLGIFSYLFSQHKFFK